MPYSIVLDLENATKAKKEGRGSGPALFSGRELVPPSADLARYLKVVSRQ